MEASFPTKAEAEEVGLSSLEDTGEPLSIPRLRQALDDLFVPEPWRYWLDFLTSALCFYGGFAAVALLPVGVPVKLLAFAVSALSLYRAMIFIHELAHFPPGRMPGFRVAWHLCCGFPLLAPDFLYGSHVDHHRRNAYGTAEDGEYAPWGSPGQRLSILSFAASSLMALPAGILRFGILGPLSWLHPGFRRWVAIHGSSLVVDARYCRAPPSPSQDRIWRIEEAAVFLYLCAAIAALLSGLIPWSWVGLLYLTLSTALFVNSLRTLVAHRYRSVGEPLTAMGQFLDSVNYPRRAWLNELWAPVGLRFHAVHHLFPGIPYHNLAAAHERLSRLLPSGSAYGRTEGHSLVGNLRELWRAAGANRSEATGIARGRPSTLVE